MRASHPSGKFYAFTYFKYSEMFAGRVKVPMKRGPRPTSTDLSSSDSLGPEEVLTAPVGQTAIKSDLKWFHLWYDPSGRAPEFACHMTSPHPFLWLLPFVWDATREFVVFCLCFFFFCGQVPEIINVLLNSLRCNYHLPFACHNKPNVTQGKYTSVAVWRFHLTYLP